MIHHPAKWLAERIGQFERGYAVEMALEQGTTEAEIKAGVEKIVGGRRMNVWTVGVTNNVDLRREAHGRPTIWHYWHAESDQVAKNIEAHFKTQGMKGYSGASEENAHNVYITW